MNADQFWARLDRSGECWLWMGATTAGGYGCLRFGGLAWRAPRLAWTLTHGEIPAGMFVCHRCDNPRCARPDHLFLGTNRENMVDAGEKGRLGKLDVSTVETIRARIASGETRESVAASLGLSRTAVGKAASGRNWAHVRGSLPPARNPGAKIDADAARSMRRRSASGEPRSALASSFGLSKSGVARVLRGEVWPDEVTAEKRRDEGDDALAEERAEREVERSGRGW